MADSNITKKALAAALKELLLEKNLAHISVSDICERCDMNRKSFYYHFRDKYDLVNWIFDNEFIGVMRTAADYTPTERIAGMEKLVKYFYENRRFTKRCWLWMVKTPFRSIFTSLLSAQFPCGLKSCSQMMI